MGKIIVSISIFCAVTGCLSFYQPDPAGVNVIYDFQIKEWQERVIKEGWSENIVEDVVNQCIKLSKYKTEDFDHWDTPKEFREKGFQGDCEDIAVFAMSTLKRLEYPYGVRILAVKALFGYHAILKVEMPARDWKIYETVPLPLNEIDRLFYRPIVEFDEKTIVYYKEKNQ